MQQTKNDELVEQRERSLRERNFIIYGLPEENFSDKTANSDTNGHEGIKAIFREIEVGSVPKSFTRLGKPNAGARPIKVTMGTISEKDNIMENLKYLKQAPDHLRKISITDDFTIEERIMIKEKVAEAVKKTEDEEGKYIFRVRGTPKNGLRLKSFPIQASPRHPQS